MSRGTISSDTLVRPDLPANLPETLRVVDCLTGSRSETNAMLFEGRLVGAGCLGAALHQIQYAQAAQTGSRTDFGGMSAAGRAASIIPRNAVRLGGNILTAADILNQIQQASERRQVENAISGFGLDRTSAADVLAARAYVWARNMLPLNLRYFRVPFSGPVTDRVAAAVMQYERTHPGTAGLASRGDGAAIAAIDGVVDGAMAGWGPVIPVIVERRSEVSPALSASSTRARSIVGISGNQRWQAHHLVPFAVVKRLPDPVQRAIAASGWTMDSRENLIALPANLATYLLPPNLTQLPYHSGSHSVLYDGDVAAALQPLAARAATIDAATLRQGMAAIEARFRTALTTDRRYHPRLN